MNKPLLPREHLEHFCARQRNAHAQGVTLTGNRDLDEMRMAVAYGMPKRSLGTILENYRNHDWAGLIAATRADRERG